MNSSFEEILEKDGRLVYTNVGDSMWPFIRQGRDLLVIERARGRLRRYDVPLYRRDSGQYVLHRVLEVRGSDYVTCGDNRWTKEYGVTDGQILGVLTAVVRGGKEIPADSPLSRLYVSVWCGLFPLRAFILRSFAFIKRIFRK